MTNLILTTYQTLSKPNVAPPNRTQHIPNNLIVI